MDHIFRSSDKGEDALGVAAAVIAAGPTKILPPRPLAIRNRLPNDASVSNLSGGTKEGSENLNNSLVFVTTPPLANRKRAASLEEERNEFHNKNQQFLQSVSKHPTQCSSPRAYSMFRGSPRKATSLESIGDRDDDDDDAVDDDAGSKNDMDLHQNRNRVELRGMHLVDDFDPLNVSLISVDDTKDECVRERDPRHPFYQSDLDHDTRQGQDTTSTLPGVHAPIFDGVTPSEMQQSIREYALELENHRESLIKQWRAEFEAELAEEAARKRSFKTCWESIYNALATLEVFICNMPLSIAASALAWATLGVVWFKFGAEHLIMFGKCQSVHFHDPKNTYRHEFPGSFSCDETTIYKSFLFFHFGCHILAAVLAFFFLMKVCLAWRTVEDDLTNPVTATPVGVICITLEILCAAAGEIGGVAVIAVSIFHGLFSFWFLYVAVVKFKLLPDPSWFPGTIGLAYAAVKAWLVCNTVGKFFLGVR